MKKIVWMAFAGLVLLNLGFGIVMLVRGRHEPDDPHLLHEVLAISRLADVHRLFFMPAAHEDLARERPDLLPGSDEHAYAQAAQMPPVFRRLDHQQPFDALLLTGDTTTYLPLLHHLAETNDFVLTWLDNASLIFRRRPAQPWTEADLAAAKVQFQGESRAKFLAGAAGRLIALNQPGAAKRALDEAQALSPNLPDVQTGVALYEGGIGHWQEALDAVNKAVNADPNFLPALTTKAEILCNAKRFDEALDISDEVVKEHPDDPTMLFFQATISHQARAFDREIAALRHLVELADAQKQSATGYHVYLGQAYAEDGDAAASLAEFETVLAAPDATGTELKFSQDCVNKIHREEAPKQ